MYQRLADEHHYTPNEIADMTPDQQIGLLSKPKVVTFATASEYQNHYPNGPRKR